MDKAEKTEPDKRNNKLAKTVILWIKTVNEKKLSVRGQLNQNTSRNCLCEDQNEKEDCYITSCKRDKVKSEE